LNLGKWAMGRTPEGASVKAGYSLIAPAAENAKQGNYAQAAGNLAGTGAMLGAPAAPAAIKAIPDAVDSFMDTGRAVTAGATAGVKAAAPSVAGGALIIGGAEGIAHAAPVAAWPARIALAYPALRSIANGFKQGGTAAAEAYQAARRAGIEPNILSLDDWMKISEANKPAEVPAPVVARLTQAQQAGVTLDKTPASTPDFQPATGVQLPSGRVPGNGTPKPQPVPAPQAAAAAATNPTPGSPGMTTPEALQAEMQAKAQPAPPVENTPLLNNITTALGLKGKFAQQTEAIQTHIRDLAARGTSSPAASSTPAASPAPASAEAPNTDASLPNAESPQSRYDSNGDLKSQQLRNQEILMKNVKAKEDRFSQAAFDNGVTPDQIQKLGWPKVTDIMVKNGAIKASELPPNLSAPGILSKLKQLQSQKIAADLAAEMKRSGTIPQQQQQ
jgi:hypothetical protein